MTYRIFAAGLFAAALALLGRGAPAGADDKKEAKLDDLNPHPPVAVTLHEHGGKHEVVKIEADTTKK